MGKSAHRPKTNFIIRSERNQNNNIILLIPVALSAFSHKPYKKQQREVRILNSNYIFEKIYWGGGAVLKTYRLTSDVKPYLLFVLLKLTDPFSPRQLLVRV